MLDLVPVADVVAALIACSDEPHPGGFVLRAGPPAYRITLAELAKRILGFCAPTPTPISEDPLAALLRVTYRSHLAPHSPPADAPFAGSTPRPRAD